MKKRILLLTIFASLSISAQLYTPGGVIQSSNPSNTNVGINTSMPYYTFQVDGNVGFYDIIMGGEKWRLHKPDYSDLLHIVPRNTSNNTWEWSKAFIFNGNNGNFMVPGKLEAKEIKVTLTPTADFVFEEDYNLPKLEEVEKHIKEKKHYLK